MSDKYRDENVNKFMASLEDDLTSIVRREFGNLNVMDILKENRQTNPELSIDEALILAMRAKGAVIMRKSTALAISLDRIAIMVNQMADEMGNDGNQNGERYRDRLSILLDFDAIVKELL